MRLLGEQFVMGQTIDKALQRAATEPTQRYSFDMLGESALCMADAERYFLSYAGAIRAIGASHLNDAASVIDARPSISVKLSALHPRYEFQKTARIQAELVPRLIALAEIASEQGIALTVDAEESDRLELSLEVLAAVLRAPSLADWEGLGLAVQAYQKRAPSVIRWLDDAVRRFNRVIHVRLVKGAYWDSEVKRAEERGLVGYPVYTRKPSTDVSYLGCAVALFAADARLRPQFATHNAHTVSAIRALQRHMPRPVEFQRLHGMGEPLYAALAADQASSIPCRVYAPVGSHEELLPYLVRRLLENGANSSFVNRIFDARLTPEIIARDPVLELEACEVIAHPGIPLPSALYPERRNSAGVNLAERTERVRLERAIAAEAGRSRLAAPRIAGELAPARRRREEATRSIPNPADRRIMVGEVIDATPSDAARALDVAAEAFSSWERTPVADRAACLERAADAFEAAQATLVSLLVREAGKTVPDALAELREAVDFLRYYAAQARATLSCPTVMPGPTGERNELHLRGRGVFVCISPWNFPLAIFTGQIAAALVTGNTVIAKPAEQTPLVADFAAELMLQAGIPEGVLSLLPGDGARLGAVLCSDARLAGVAFTGSNEVATHLSRQLAAREGPRAVTIFETGGQNVMIADSSALPEQLVNDVLVSAFGSAGQRCSALRVLCVQEEIADRVIALLLGAMNELAVGDPATLANDIGPVIDEEACARLESYVASMAPHAARIHRVRLDPLLSVGHYVAPTVLEVGDITEVVGEVFGPILHVLRYSAARLDELLAKIDATGYGLTLGVHTRMDSMIDHVRSRSRVGNLYVNRNMIGAVVGVQPFGGCGLSGTGPKAGGPHTLQRFLTEQTVTINTAALGGNAGLLALAD